jgi:tetratricopeptide (TPR) repeat protein
MNTQEVWMRTSVWLPSFLCAVAIGSGCSRSTPDPAGAPATPCAVVLAPDGSNDSRVAELQARIRAIPPPPAASPTALRDLESLGFHYVHRARRTNDPGDYTLAEQAALCLESRAPAHPNALLIRGHVLHQQHRFREAEAVARQLVAKREFVLDYGLLGDALMEQGKVADAASAYQRMIDIKPFYQSYIRAAHLRWLKSDRDGAIDLMRQALASASPRDPEAIAWAYTRVAHYELHAGRLEAAAAAADAALSAQEDYAAALLARGRVHAAAGRDREALQDLRKAAGRNPLPELQWALADALRAADRPDEAQAIEDDIVTSGVRSDPRTLALFLATRRRDTARAVRLAEHELTQRSDVFTLDAYAWALAADGRHEEASAVMARALVEGTEDARLFLHAASIAAAQGRAADARQWSGRARRTRFTLLPSELELLRAHTAHSHAEEN